MRRRGLRLRRRLSTSFKRFRRGRGRYVDKKAFKRNCRGICVSTTGALSGTFNVAAENGVTGSVPTGFRFCGANPGSSNTTAGPGFAVAVAGSADQYDCPFVCNFQFNDVVNATEFSTLFDQYKLNYVVMKFIPTWNSNIAGTYTGTIPSIEFKRDHDDSTNPDLQQWAQTASVKGPIMFDKPITIKVKPTMLTPALRSGTGTTFPVISSARYCDMNLTDVEHFGIKGWIRNLYCPATAGTFGSQLFKLDLTYYFTCKGLQ